MAKAHITTKSGAQVLIEGDAAEVARIVSQIEHAPHAKPLKEGRATTNRASKQDKKPLTASGLVLGLKQEQFFDKLKNLSEIAAELEKSGYLYPTTTLSGVALSLVKRKELTRTKKDGKWVYGKR